MYENMRNNALFIFFFLMLALVIVPSLRAQSDCDETYLPGINSALDKGDCETAQRFYEAYKVCAGGDTNADIERRIQECLNPQEKKSFSSLPR